ncbi:DMT family transporter [Paenibacillus radicis (ex Xue et al. 2023)]|uniref:DMT family transporter n=1 Tax=Paenibacillus radicis (ex Xue et al. 2023) TaxID=2972489 RepID=A0ABT1YM72_9BACL|nr:DMT family transporter [Paenibacillus radicis (ex Xue et al. 2023)]MCR8633845.1 DMT family transporter [Paenibacillus radicis (ex Xue et al. 2023)]
MEKVFILLFIVAGIGLSSQAAINGGLGKTVGALEATFISFLVGTIVLFLFILFFGKGNVLLLFTVPKWQLVGGLIGAAYIAILTFAVPKIGVGVSIISVICGQILMSMLVDHFGWFNGAKFPINGSKIIGVAFLVISLIFLAHGNSTKAAGSLAKESESNVTDNAEGNPRLPTEPNKS